jgi:cytochrome c-type biogenesis protein CcmH
MIDLENSLAIDLERQQAQQVNQQSGTWLVWLIVAIVPVVSILLYIKLGAYQVIENPALAQARTQTQSQNPHAGGDTPSMDELIGRLKEHLRDNPQDSQGWFMLGRTMTALQQFDNAVAAFRRSQELTPDQPGIMLALADSLAMVNNGDMSGEPEQLVKRALEVSPNDVTALWLAGLAAEQANRNREAYDYWTRLLPMLDNDPKSASEVKTLLASLKEKQPDLPDIEVASAPIASEGLKVSVTLDPKLASQVKGDELLFIYAKASSGPPMPLAAKRLKAADLPVEVTLSDQDAMLPQMKLSSFGQVLVGARISHSGNPIAQAGDLFDESGAIDHKTFKDVVHINIDQIK